MTKWEVDKVGRFAIEYTSINLLDGKQFFLQCGVLLSGMKTELYGAPGCDETAVNFPSFQSNPSITAGFRDFKETDTLLMLHTTYIHVHTV